MAEAEAEGARAAGAHVDVKRVPELVPRAMAQASHYKLDQIAPVAQVDDLIDYDAVIFGTPTRYGNMIADGCGRARRPGAGAGAERGVAAGAA